MGNHSQGWPHNQRWSICIRKTTNSDLQLSISSSDKLGNSSPHEVVIIACTVGFRIAAGRRWAESTYVSLRRCVAMGPASRKRSARKAHTNDDYTDENRVDHGWGAVTGVPTTKHLGIKRGIEKRCRDGLGHTLAERWTIPVHCLPTAAASNRKHRANTRIRTQGTYHSRKCAARVPNESSPHLSANARRHTQDQESTKTHVPLSS